MQLWLAVLLLLKETQATTSPPEILGRGLGLSSTEGEVDDLRARAILREAEDGSLAAVHYGGLLYLYGKGVPRSSEKAVTYFRKAAERGHPASQTALGVLLRHGLGVARDDYASFAWLKRAASKDPEAMWLLGVAYKEQGDIDSAMDWLTRSESPDAMYWLGVIAEYNNGTTDAMSWYDKAASLGHVDAMYNLGLMRAYGRGCEQDLTRAGALFQKAAANHHAGAMYYIGVMHLYGQGGLAVNYQAARAWFQKAEGRRDPAFSDEARDARLELENSLALASDFAHDALKSHATANELRYK